jgi:hypothetical protein
MPLRDWLPIVPIQADSYRAQGFRPWCLPLLSKGTGGTAGLTGCPGNLTVLPGKGNTCLHPTRRRHFPCAPSPTKYEG